jgi:hypothetical protein
MRRRGRPKGFASQTAAITGKSKSQINRLAKPKAKKKPMAKAKSSKAKSHPPIETITIAVGIDAARTHYADEFAKLPANRHDAEIDRLNGVLRRDQAATGQTYNN